MIIQRSSLDLGYSSYWDSHNPILESKSRIVTNLNTTIITTISVRVIKIFLIMVGQPLKDAANQYDIL